MAQKLKQNWIRKKYSELLSEIEKLDWLMIGIHIGLDETIDPILHFKKAFEKMGEKMDRPDTFVSLLKKKGAGTKTSKAMAKFLRAEAATDYPFLYRTWTVMLWSILENFVKDFLVEWLARNPNIMKSDVIQKLPIHLGEYEALNRIEKQEYIIDAVEFQLRSKSRKGVSQFESLLEQFDLSGKVDDDLRTHILELQQVRHVLVHRNGIVDKTLVQACPWIVPGIGKTIFIDYEIYQMYNDAVLKYAFEIANRAYTRLRKPKH